MIPPIWLDAAGKPRPVRPCSRCGTETPAYRFPIDDLRRVGWRLFTPAS